MIVITLAFGLVSTMFFLRDLIGIQMTPSNAYLSLVFLLLLSGFLTNRWFKVSLSYFGLSVLRYAIFTVQFTVLIHVFLPEIALDVAMLGVGWTFLFRTVIPSLFGNFGVREASAMMFFEPLVNDMTLILFPCLLIWFINTVVPSIFGAFALLSLNQEKTTL